MNLWIATEENPKVLTIESVIKLYGLEYSKKVIIDNLRIIPSFKNGKYDFSMNVTGVKIEGINNIKIITYSGTSSSLDFLVYLQNKRPNTNSIKNLKLAVEETKTNDNESRNAVYQRITKFTYFKNYYKKCNIPLYMLYNEEYNESSNRVPSNTNIFGTNIMLSLGIKIYGKNMDNYFNAFKSIDDMISFKNNISTKKSCVPLTIAKKENNIYISANLSKPKTAGNIGSDPNIGFVCGVSQVIRNFGFDGNIIVINHNVKQNNIDKCRDNKFIQMCNFLNITLENITLPKVIAKKFYTKTKDTCEKYGSILFDQMLRYSGFTNLYENHAGCERSYYKPNGEFITIPKKIIGSDKTYPIPDFVNVSEERKLIILTEGKKDTTVKNGIEEIEYYDEFGQLLNKYYPNYEIYRCISIYGGNWKSIPNKKIAFYLSDDGDVIMNDRIKTILK